MDVHDLWNETHGFIRSAGLLAGTAAVIALIEGPVVAQTPANLEFKPMTYEIKPFPFDPKAINDLSEKNPVSENNYIRAVKRLNAIGVQLAEPMADRIARRARPRGRSRLQDPRLFVDGQATRQPMGCRSYDDFGRWAAGARPRQVRACLSHGFRRQGHLLVGAYVEAISWAARLEHYRSET
jgi:hypothetical protein